MGYPEIIESITKPILKHIDHLPSELFFFLEQDRHGIFMPHGMADKTYHNPIRLKTIRHLLYSGPLWKQHLIDMGIPAERIHIVGCPRLDPVFQGEVEYIPSNRIRVTWCPTHNAIQSISSSPHFEPLLEKLASRYEVSSSVHPARRDDGKTSLDAIVNSDVILSDTSSLLLESLAIGKPVVLLDWLVRDGVHRKLKGTLEDRIYREGICYHAQSFEDLPRVIDLALDKGIDAKTKDFIDGILPIELRGHSGEAAAKVLLELSAPR